MDDIVSKLNDIEEDLGYTPKEMAELGKCSLSSYHRYRSGKSIPRLDFLWHLLQSDTRIRAEWILRDIEPRYVFTREEIRRNEIHPFRTENYTSSMSTFRFEESLLTRYLKLVRMTCS